MDIIQYLLSIIQYLYQQNCWLINVICRYIPLKQWAFEDSHSPSYQKLKVDELPNVQVIHQEWDWRLLIPYFEHRYHVKIKPVSRRKECDIPQDVVPQNKVPVSCTKTANYNSNLTNTPLIVCRKKRRTFFLCVSGISVIVVLIATDKKRERTTPTTARSFSHP